MLGRSYRWLRRRWYVALGTIIATLLMAAYLFPWLLKDYIEKHSEEWIHRKVVIGSIVLNPFTGVYAVEDFVCYEPGSETVFVRFEKLGVKSDLIDGFRQGIWHFREAELRSPYVRVKQEGELFNFSDLLELGGGENAGREAADSTVIAFDVVGIQLSEGQIDYGSDLLPTPVTISALDVSCTRISTAQTAMDFVIGFTIGGGGRVDGRFSIDTKAGRYTVNTTLVDFALAQTKPYLDDLMDCGEFKGLLDAELNVDDSYVDTTSLFLSATMDLRDLELTEPAGGPLLTVARLHAELDTLVSSEERFAIGDVLLDGAHVHAVLLNDGSDNWTRLMRLSSDSIVADGAAGVSESNVFVLLADYISYLGSQFVASAYSARSVRLADCAVHFEDFTPRLPFRYEVTDIALEANSVSSANDAGRIRVSAVLEGSGVLTGSAAFDPNDLRNVKVDLDVRDMRLPPLDPYTRWYAAYPTQAGVLSYSTTTVVQNGSLDSRNTLRVDQLKFGRKVTEHDTGIYVLPLRLAAGLLKDAKGVIHLDVPLKGDLKDPTFRVWPIVWQVLKNLVSKAAAAPANLLARAVGAVDARELEGIAFEYGQAVPGAMQWRSLDELARALAARPELRVDLVALVDPGSETAELGLFAVKRRHLFGEVAQLSPNDSARIVQLGNTDSSFVAFVASATPALGGMPVQERCVALIGAEVLGSQQRDVEYARREHTMQRLLEKGVPATRVAFREGTPDELQGWHGRPGYRFIYDAADDSLDADTPP